MNFVQLNLIFVPAAAVVLLLALLLARLGRGDKRKVLICVAASLVVLVALTAVFDNVMIASGLFDYAGDTLNGTHVGLAPIEDFAYPIAAALLLPGLWLLFTRGRKA
ncbi:lycopene cyclase domain-containing protein [Arthrobacter sp.]|uniref:lycopene cyclase domain-containing protein n=1 Tax=Arthrobacter sp. TaxID=1667 RepID=UPI0026DEBC21|nr:lycopene cyclase domain-containing protein [Arthrobacter sp.]MDO5754221.1 lycopene cyclase domain-containing protein [Arthrobacter sp.]